MGLSDAEFEARNRHQNRIARERKESLEAMQSHGQFHRDTKDGTATNQCCLCNERIENVDHIFGGCKMLAQKEYKRRNDKDYLNLHWPLCKKVLDKSDERYHHVPEKVLNEAGTPRTFWDIDIQTNRMIEHR